MAAKQLSNWTLTISINKPSLKPISYSTWPFAFYLILTLNSIKYLVVFYNNKILKESFVKAVDMSIDVVPYHTLEQWFSNGGMGYCKLTFRNK